jgi:hypothetical protein
VTVLESKEREKGSNNDSESSLETETEAGVEAEMEAEMAFSCFRMVFSIKRTGDSVFLWEGGITVFKDITGMDRLCNKGETVREAADDRNGW